MRERFIAHLERIWPQTVSIADKTFLEAIRDLHVQYDMSDATVELQTFTDLMIIHRHYTHRTQEDNDKAIQILLDKINDPEKINWHPRFYKTLAECDITLPPSRSCRLQICPHEYLPRCSHGNRKPKI